MGESPKAAHVKSQVNHTTRQGQSDLHAHTFGGVLASATCLGPSSGLLSPQLISLSITRRTEQLTSEAM